MPRNPQCPAMHIFALVQICAKNVCSRVFGFLCTACAGGNLACAKICTGQFVRILCLKSLCRKPGKLRTGSGGTSQDLHKSCRRGTFLVKICTSCAEGKSACVKFSTNVQRPEKLCMPRLGAKALFFWPTKPRLSPEDLENE